MKKSGAFEEWTAGLRIGLTGENSNGGPSSVEVREEGAEYWLVETLEAEERRLPLPLWTDRETPRPPVLV